MKRRGWALLPFIVFIVLFAGVGIISGDFYGMPALVAFVAACNASPVYGSGAICDRVLYFSLHGDIDGNDYRAGPHCSRCLTADRIPFGHLHWSCGMWRHVWR